MSEQETKELLELAAKSIGMTLRYNTWGSRDANQPWDPLEDYGDAVNLLMRLRLAIAPADDDGDLWFCFRTDEKGNEEILAIDKYFQITVTRAAAAIGKKMK